jgi:O-antigen ligase
MLIMILIATITVPYILDYTQKFKKLLIRIIIVSITIVIAYKLVMNIPALYNSIGIRIENIIKVIIIGSTNEASFNTRQKLIEKGVLAYKQKPILGWGLDNFRYVINNGGYYAHNNFVEILVNGGIVGFCFYYLKYFYLILLTYICKKHKTKDEYKKIKAFRVLIITLFILEYWQVTYYYRLFMLPFIILLVICNNYDKTRLGCD